MRPILLLALLGVVPFRTVHSQTGATVPTAAFPRTPAGQAARGLIREFNAGTLQLPRWSRWLQIVGPVTARQIRQTSPTRLTVDVQGDLSRAWMRWDITADAEGRTDPAQVVVFWLNGQPDPGIHLTKPSPLPDAAVESRVSRYLDRLAGADRFSGTVLIARHGQPIFQHAYGMADRAHQVPNRIDTRFNLASGGKIFTAVEVAHLVSAGRLAFDDSVGKWLPEYPIAAGRSATVGQLLSHTAGLGRSQSDWIASRDPFTLADLVRMTATTSAFAPGSSVQYCNECFLVAGLIAERAGGTGYDTLVHRDLFDQAGMRDTDWKPIDQADPRRATPYSNFVRTDSGQQYVPGPRRDASGLQGRRGTPAGGAWSTAPDLLAFVKALLGFRLADSATTQQLFAVHGKTPFGSSYGYGFEVSDATVRSFGKGGNAQGVSSQFDVYPEFGLVVIVLSNYDSSAQVAAYGIRELLLEVRPEF